MVPKSPHGLVSPKKPTPNSPLGRELKSPKGYLSWVKISITYNVLAPASPALVAVWVKIIIAYNVLAPASPALVGGLWNAHSLAMERLKFGYRLNISPNYTCVRAYHLLPKSPHGSGFTKKTDS